MSEINSNLERRAAQALERAKNDTATQPNTVTPIAPTPSQEPQYDAIGPLPTDEEMSKHGAVTAADLVDDPASADEDDDASIIISDPTAHTPPASENDEMVILTTAAKEQMGNMPASEQEAFLQGIMPEITTYKKQMMIEAGLTPTEAMEAAQNRIKTKAAEANKTYGEAHPDGVILTIDKSQEKDLALDDDTQRKLQHAKAIKLVVVESAELETLRVKPTTDRLPMSHLRDICGSLAHYSVPLLEYGDYVTFRGAQSAALVNATSNDDDTLLDTLDKKATLLYNCFQSGTVQTRYKGEGEMSYDDFCQWFKYADLDMGVYAIVTASAMEVSESVFNCVNKQCRKSFNISYNNKSLLDLSEIPDIYKERLNAIDDNRSNPGKIAALIEEYGMATRVKSPFSKNIFEMKSATIAEAHNRIEKCIPIITADNALNSALLLYISKIWLYDPTDDAYVMVDFNEDPVYGFHILETLHQVDLELIMKWAQDHTYTPAFKIKTKCPHCGRESTDNLRVDDMIFLHARASLTEIQ